MDKTAQTGATAGGEGNSPSDLEAVAEEAGIDLATIRERLRMTLAERLAANTRGWRLVQLFRRAGSRGRTGSTSGS